MIISDYCNHYNQSENIAEDRIEKIPKKKKKKVVRGGKQEKTCFLSNGPTKKILKGGYKK